MDEKKRREKWYKTKGGCHDYGNDSMDDEETEDNKPDIRTCKCGSVTHKTTNHRECPLKKTATSKTAPTAETFSFSDDETATSPSGSDTDSNSEDSDMDVDVFEQISCWRPYCCDCPNFPMHRRTCPLNLRTVGKVNLNEE